MCYPERGVSLFLMFCPCRLCRAANGHDRSDQGVESQPGHPLLGVQTVCHTHFLPQGEKHFFSLLSESAWQTDTAIFLTGGFHIYITPCPPLSFKDFPLLVICTIQIHLGIFKHKVNVEQSWLSFAPCRRVNVFLIGKHFSWWEIYHKSTLWAHLWVGFFHR